MRDRLLILILSMLLGAFSAVSTAQANLACEGIGGASEFQNPGSQNTYTINFNSFISHLGASNVGHVHTLVSKANGLGTMQLMEAGSPITLRQKFQTGLTVKRTA